MINDLEKKLESNKPGRPLGKDKESVIRELIKNVTDLYKSRSDNIGAFEGKEQTEEGEKAEETGLNWLHWSKNSWKI